MCNYPSSDKIYRVSDYLISASADEKGKFSALICKEFGLYLNVALMNNTPAEHEARKNMITNIVNHIADNEEYVNKNDFLIPTQ